MNTAISTTGIVVVGQDFDLQNLEVRSTHSWVKEASSETINVVFDHLIERLFESAAFCSLYGVNTIAVPFN